MGGLGSWLVVLGWLVALPGGGDGEGWRGHLRATATAGFLVRNFAQQTGEPLLRYRFVFRAMTKPAELLPPLNPELPVLPPGTHLHRLANGLEIILRPDTSAPVISAQAWCRAGSVDEGPWLGAGLSHVLEHMLFKGTSTRGAGRIDQEVQAAGGYMNAYTSFDRTVYWINAPSSGTRVVLDILCDIFQNATIPADELTKELDVIRREMDMGQDDPGRRASQGFFAAAYQRSPFRHPVIGHRDIFDRITRDDLVAYYQAKYAPNNCFLVVVGDFDPAAVLAQIQAAYAGSKARAVPASYVLPEPRQTAPRESIESAPVEHAHLHLGWHMGDQRDADTPALDVLATLMGHGRSSRLYRAIREKGLAHSVSAWTYTPGSVGLFGVSAVCDADKVDVVREAIRDELQRVTRELMSSDELARAVKQFTVGTLSTRKTMEGQAQDLGSSWLAAADLHFSERYLGSVRRLQPADLLRIAGKYLLTEGQTTYVLRPATDVAANAAGATKVAENPTQMFVLPNGLRLLVKEDHRLPFVEFRAAFAGGLLAETAADAGLTALMAKLLVKGTTGRSAEDIAMTIENVGGSLEPYAGNNSFGLTAEVLSEDFAIGLELIADVMRRPSWPETALERERLMQLASIKGQRDQLLQCAFKSLRRQLFGDAGYGLDALGTEANVKGFTVADLQRFYARLLTPSNGVVAVYGDVRVEAVRAAIDHAFGDWTSSQAPWQPPAALAVPLVPRSDETRDKEQAVLALGFRGTTLTAKDRYALELIQEACSDMGSRLFMRIRDELGLAYYVGASNFVGRTPGYFAFYCGTAPEQVDLVERELRAQAEELRINGLTVEELSRAKAKIIGQRQIGRQDLGQVALSAALDELYGLGHAHSDGDDARYEAVTLEEVRVVANRYLQPDQAAVAIIRGKPGVAESAVG